MVGNVTNMLNASSTNPTPGGKSDLGKDDFLKLMMAQLKYQDPMNPVDGSEYSAQLAQFSSLEQLQNINSSLETSIGANYQLAASINNTMAAALIGKDVKLDSDTLKYSGQESVDIGYTMPAAAKSVEINIYNEHGVIIKTFTDLPKSSGEHQLSWDFTDNDGRKIDNDDYSFEIVATNSSDEEMVVDTYLIGSISAVRYTDNGTMLVINNVEYSLDQISEILNPDLGKNEDA